MAHFAKSFSIVTRKHNEVVDITEEVARAVAESGVRDGQLAVYTPHATAAVTVNENDDPNIGADFLRALGNMVPEHDGWLHDRVLVAPTGPCGSDSRELATTPRREALPRAETLPGFS